MGKHGMGLSAARISKLATCGEILEELRKDADPEDAEMLDRVMFKVNLLAITEMSPEQANTFLHSKQGGK